MAAAWRSVRRYHSRCCAPNLYSTVRGAHGCVTLPVPGPRAVRMPALAHIAPPGREIREGTSRRRAVSLRRDDEIRSVITGHHEHRDELSRTDDQTEWKVFNPSLNARTRPRHPPAGERLPSAGLGKNVAVRMGIRAVDAAAHAGQPRAAHAPSWARASARRVRGWPLQNAWVKAQPAALGAPLLLVPFYPGRCRRVAVCCRDGGFCLASGAPGRLHAEGSERRQAKFASSGGCQWRSYLLDARAADE